MLLILLPLPPTHTRTIHQVKSKGIAVPWNRERGATVKGHCAEVSVLQLHVVIWMLNIILKCVQLFDKPKDLSL